MAVADLERCLVRAGCAAMIVTMNDAQPLLLSELTVEPEWIDYNGHMNVGYYGVAFDRAADLFTDQLGLDAAYRERSHCSTYVLETRTAFVQELKLGERVTIDLQLLDFDAKRLHYFLRMLHGEHGALCACTEIMLMHMDMDMDSVSGTPMPAAVLEKVRRLAQSHRKLAPPKQIGRAIGIRR